MTLFDGETGYPVRAAPNDEESRDTTAVDDHDAGVVFVFDPGTETARIQFVVDREERRLVARATLDDGDGLAALYRAVQSRVRRYDTRIAKPHGIPEHLNLVHYLAAASPAPPGSSIRAHLVSTDDAVDVGVPTVADAVGVLAFFRERAPWKSLAVHSAGTASATGDAAVTVTVDDTFEEVTYLDRDESWVDEDASAEPDDGPGDERSSDDGTPTGRPDAGTPGSSSVSPAGGSSVSTADPSAVETPAAATDESTDAGGTTPGDAQDGPGDGGSSDVRPGDGGSDGGAPDAPDQASAGGEDGPSSDEALAPHHEQRFKAGVTDVRADLVAITDRVDAITGTADARQRLFAAAISGEVLSGREFVVVPDEDTRMESRRQQARYLALYGLLVVGLAAGVLTGRADPLGSALAARYPLDLGPLAGPPLSLAGPPIRADVALLGSALVTAVATAWVLAPRMLSRDGAGAVLAAVRDQVTVVGSGTVPTGVRDHTDGLGAKLDELEVLYGRVVDGRSVVTGETRDFEGFVEQHLLAASDLPAVEVTARSERRRQYLGGVLAGALVGSVGAALAVVALWVAAGVLAANVTAALDVAVAVAAGALLVAAVKAGVLGWRHGRSVAAALLRRVAVSLPLVGSGAGPPRLDSGGGAKGASSVDHGGARDGSDGTGPPKALPSGTTAAGYEHGDGDTPFGWNKEEEGRPFLVSAFAFLVVVSVDVAIFRGPLSVPEAVPGQAAAVLMWAVPALFLVLTVVYWLLDS